HWFVSPLLLSTFPFEQRERCWLGQKTHSPTQLSHPFVRLILLRFPCHFLLGKRSPLDLRTPPKQRLKPPLMRSIRHLFFSPLGPLEQSFTYFYLALVIFPA